MLEDIHVITTNEKQIEKLNNDIAKRAKKITTRLWKEFKNWKPVEDEKAIHLSLNPLAASYVYFIEEVYNESYWNF